MDTCNGDFTDKEYNVYLQPANLHPISYQFVFMDLDMLNKTMTGKVDKLSLWAEQFWEMNNGYPH